ncbi:MAG: hypothetical protein KatS3mg105_5069 [Gemmatales bacterium]|nr:MAG: hypothetical protein KatS3mg105_5069 [Gemmatales bacterium]
MQSPDNIATGNSHRERLKMPRPTAWPMVLAAGVALIATGIATSLAVSAAGLAVFGIALAGWLSELRPGRGEVEVPWVPVARRAQPVAVSQRAVAAPREGLPGHRVYFPEHVHPYSSGVVGGLVGGVAMAAVALAYGMFSGRGVWYPINMLSAVILTRYNAENVQAIEQFDLTSLLVATALHLVISLLVGLFYGILLPTLPTGAMRIAPVIWGGIIAPLLWSSVLYGFMEVINPVMSQHVAWPWFIASQFAYGIVAGWYVATTEQVPVTQTEGGRSVTGTREEADPDV